MNTLYSNWALHIAGEADACSHIVATLLNDITTCQTHLIQIEIPGLRQLLSIKCIDIVFAQARSWKLEYESSRTTAQWAQPWPAVCVSAGLNDVRHEIQI